MTGNLWRLPGPASWLSAVLGDFDDGAFLVLRLPRTWSGSELFEAFREARASAWLELAEVSGDRQVAEELCDLAFGASTAEDALERLRSDGTVPWLRVTGPLDTEQLGALAEGHARLESTPAAPVVVEHVGPLTAPKLSASPTLRVHSLYGVLTTLDTQVLLREMVPGLSMSRREEVAELAVHDLGLAVDLARLEPASHDGYVNACVERAHALGLGDTAPSLPNASQTPVREPGAMDLQWQAGAVDLFNGQLVVHPGVAEDREVNRRLWRGQIRALLPFFDEMRLALLDEMHRRGLYPVPSRGDAVELIDLLRALEASRDNQVLTEAARQLTRARNELAHLRLVDEGRREQLREALRRARLPDLAGL